MTTEQFLISIEDAFKQADLPCSRGVNTISVRYSIYTGMELQIIVDNSNKVSFYFYERTSSWAYDDERTDIHDIFSLILASWCQKFIGYSYMIYNVGHPADSGLDDFEIYARYILPTQTNYDIDNISDVSLEKMQSLGLIIGALHEFIWQVSGGCPCNECRKHIGATYNYRDNLNKPLMNKIHKALGTAINYNLKDRFLPTWNYYRDFDKGVSIVKSKSLTRFVSSLLNERNNTIDSINGKIIIDNGCYYFISNELIRKAENIFLVLEAKFKSRFIVIENKILAIGNSYFIIIDSNSGFSAFKEEKELLRIRHDIEYNSLFKPSKLDWSTQIDDDDFENLILELLKREPNVIRIRKLAHTNEPDGGKDLIMDMKVIPMNGEILPEGITPYTIISIIIQCKAYRNGVGKSDVLDIRDTIEDYEYDGFFLAVSSYTKRNLTEHLDKMKRKNKYWIDWWTRIEIEEKILKHQDLLHAFPKIFSAK